MDAPEDFAPAPADDSSRIDFSARFRVQRRSLDGCLLELMQQGDGVSTGKALLLQAIRAYWLAIAMQQSDRYSAIEVQQMARRCCAALQQQVFYLSAQFDLTVMTANEMGGAIANGGAPTSSATHEIRSEPKPNYQSLLDQL
ncbi:hypothetical protein H6F67_25885 [Microcoleus sp. FACHB-1515]|uniref:hypothetical protein n=1 Tax=Cyanophyceae TaxID=3028117 RepID=UPI001685965E|nr:hypothetical protein [Microcoleus sp. FACHB-1515]MBD2093280.1 hypothetical protein [Microcoleus sp. FACHB-1515]